MILLLISIIIIDIKTSIIILIILGYLLVILMNMLIHGVTGDFDDTYCVARDFETSRTAVEEIVPMQFTASHLSIIVIIIIIIVITIIITSIIITIIITRPWPAFGRQGLDGTSGRYNFNW